MTIVNLVSSLEKYSLDIVCLGFLVCAVTSGIKKVVPDNYKKYLTIVPFIVGIIVYALYIVLTVGASFLKISVLESGFKCGMMATIYYVLYEQFIRGKNPNAKFDIKQLTVCAQLENVVVPSYVKSSATQIISQIKDNLHDTTYCIQVIKDILIGRLQAGVSESDITATSMLIIPTLRAMNKKVV